MKTITLNDLACEDLLVAAQSNNPYLLQPDTKVSIISQLGVPIVPKPTNPQSVPGYKNVIWKDWDVKNVLPPINTKELGGWKSNSVLIVAFTPDETLGVGNASLAPWPNDGTYPTCKISIDTTPGNFSLAAPWQRKGNGAVSIQWQVGGKSRSLCVLQPGTKYYISCTWEGQDMRLQVNKPG